jgi:putative ABC transport system permease protein
MTIRRLLKSAAMNLYASRQRSSLAVLGIVIGIASVIAMVSLGTIARVQALEQFQRLGTDIMTLQTSRAPRRVEGFGLADARELAGRVPFVLRASPRIENNLSVRYLAGTQSRTVFGVDPEEFAVQRMTVAQGRLLTSLDHDQRVCVLGAKAVGALATKAEGPPPGINDWIKVDGQPFLIVGILHEKDVGGLGDSRVNEAVYLPIEFALRKAHSPDIGVTTIQFQPGVSPSAASDRLIAMMKQWKGEGIDFSSFVPEQLLRQMDAQVRTMTVLLGIIASISLIVGGVGVMNIMLVSVTERRKEIGVRRALGARRRDIQVLFLTESGLLTLVGGLGGAIVGIGAAWIVASQVGWRPMVAMTPVVIGVGVSVTLGVFFGWYPARKAAALLPIEAMRG